MGFFIVVGVALFIQTQESPGEHAAELIDHDIERNCAEFRRNEGPWRGSLDIEGRRNMSAMCRSYGY